LYLRGATRAGGEVRFDFECPFEAEFAVQIAFEQIRI
jgi:hypothetical protein